MIIEEIDKYLAGTRENHGKRDPIVYWPSEASANASIGGTVGSCIRKSFYHIMGIESSNPYDVRMLRIFELGKMIEQMEINWATKAKADVLLENHYSFIKVYKDITIKGDLDAIFKYQDKPLGIEYKSGWGYNFRKEIFGERNTTPFPKLQNLMQVMIYLDAMKNDSKYPLNFFSLIYVDRGSCETKEFAITLSDEGFAIVNGQTYKNFSITDIYEKYVLLHKYVITNSIPPADYKNYYSIDDAKRMFRKNLISRNVYEDWIKKGHGCDWNCQYCNYYEHCKLDSDQELW